MSLKVYKDTQANRQYENSFFREFQANLSYLFEKHNKSGLLIGFGDLPDGDNLYPDCVLITKKRILIIDFKHYDKIKVYLPSGANFYSEKWNTSTPNLYVKGGSKNNANPYAQLAKQREKFEKLLGYRPNEDVGGIGALVLFDGDVKISGEIPHKEDFWFRIADKYSFPNAIMDMIDLKSDDNNDFEAIKSEYFFNCEEYVDNVTIDFEAYEAAELASEELEKILSEKDRLQEEIDEQKKINKELREKGESVEKGIDFINKKVELLRRKEAEFEEAQADFDEKKNAYEISEYNYKSELEKTKQEQAKTEQLKNSAKAEREKTKQALIQHQEFERVEKRKKTWTIMLAIVFAVIIIGAISLIVKEIKQENEKREQEEQALINDKKTGKTCIELDELSKYVGEKNVCVEYVVGDISSNSYIIYLNRTKNTDFAAIIWQKNNIISLEEAKSKYFNKRIRVRGKITFYDSEKYKYHQIEVSDLSQIEILD